MTPYEWAWLAVAVSGPLALLALGRATRGWLPRLRPVVGWLLLVWLLLPAPVPGYPGHYAPAFLVFTFESLFQNPGRPDDAAAILLAGTAAALALALLAGIVRRRRNARRPAGR
ncbi:MAG: hypothetical protein ACODAC_11960 [Pseudomonadota bacterium]